MYKRNEALRASERVTV